MAFKPMEEAVYAAYLKIVGWSLVKAGHGRGKKREVIAPHVHKTEKKFKERGLQWPPQKKSKNT